MLKLYRFTDTKKDYWETWKNEDGSHTVHWGELGTTGQSKAVKSSFLKKAETSIQKEIDNLVAQGFHPIAIEDHITLLVEYAVDGMGSREDVEKRHRLEEKMNETLGWTGLGACDGGSIGSGTMEVCNFVVDFEAAKAVIAKDLEGTEFANFTRIYDENA
jgi:predicted DNA-binding WGR domain protein